MSRPRPIATCALEGGRFRLEAELLVGRSTDEVFAFFADARNLETLTPPWLRFGVVTPQPIAMGVGTVIDYRLRVHGIPVAWQSEITVWDPGSRFVDVQRRGPYRHWVHEHTFVARRHGTIVRDVVDYAVPGGRLCNWLFVERDLRRIFAFRRRALAALFACS